MAITGNTSNVDAELLRRLSAWNAALGNKYAVHIGWRSNADQQIAYDKYLAGTGPTAAKPGASMHNQSPALAVDLRGINSYAAGSGHTTYAERVLGKKYGLTWPVGFQASGSVEFGTTEPWHVQKLPGWSGSFPGEAAPLSTTTSSNKLSVNGDFGPLTIKRLQGFLGVPQTGVFDYTTKVKLQKFVNVAPDGIFGPNSTKALQKIVGASVDGSWGSQTTTKLQTWLNNQ